MIKIDTKTDTAAGCWRQFRPGVEVKIRPCTPKDYRLAVKGLAPDEVPPVVQTVTHHVTMEWRGVVDQDDAPLPCTPAMIDLVCSLEEGFAEWLMAESRAIYQGLLISQGDELKN